MSLSIIVAMSEGNRVIGKNNEIPWHLPEDLKHFKKTTMGRTIIMGRKTFESIGRPLPGRRNVVLTRNPFYFADGVSVFSSLEEALSCEPEEEEAFVIGGSEIYRQALRLPHRLYLTLIHRDYDGDSHFPPFDLETDYELVASERRQSEKAGGMPFSFLVADRVHNSTIFPE